MRDYLVEVVSVLMLEMGKFTFVCLASLGFVLMIHWTGLYQSLVGNGIVPTWVVGLIVGMIGLGIGVYLLQSDVPEITTWTVTILYALTVSLVVVIMASSLAPYGSWISLAMIAVGSPLSSYYLLGALTARQDHQAATSG